MANEIVIKVKTDNSALDFSAVDKALAKIGDSVARATQRASRSFDDARESVGRFGREGESVTRATERIGQGFTRATESASRFNRSTKQMGEQGGGGGFLGLVSRLGSALSGTFASGTNDAAKSIAGFGQRLAETSAQAVATNAASSLLSGGLNLAVTAAMAISSAGLVAIGVFTALAPALLVAGGAAAGAAALIIGAASAIGTLGIGLGGIGDALSAHTKMMTTAGGAAKNTGEQEHQAAIRVRDATRNLADAKRQESEAIAEVNRARQEEIDRLKDLDAQIRSQTISEAEAKQALEEAQLAQANMSGRASDLEKREAQTRVDRAQFEYDETVRRMQSLAAQRKKADKDGIDGSDQVQAALKRQAQAHESVIRAQEQLTEAQRKTAIAAGGGAAAVDKFAEAMKKLSPNARELVNTLIDLQKPWDAMKKRVQDKLLAGTADEVRDLAGKWIPALDDILGNMAGRLNNLGKQLMGALGNKEFIDNIKAASNIGGEFISVIGGGIPSLLDGFARLAASSGPVLRVIANAIRGIFEWFDKWITSAEKSGALKRFMDQAADSLGKIFNITKLALRVAGQLIEILFPSSKSASDSVLDSITGQLESLSEYLADPRTQAAIKAMAEKTKEFITWVVTKAIPTIGDWASAFNDFVTTVTRGAVRIRQNATLLWNYLRTGWLTFINYVAGKMLDLVNTIDTTLGRIIPGLSAKLAPARSALQKFRKDTNDELNKINNKTIDIRFRQVGDSLAQIVLGVAGKLGKSSGGAIGAATGGARSGLTWVGEHGPELADLPAGSRVHSNPDSMRMAGGQGGGGTMRLSGTLKLAPDRMLERGVMDALMKALRIEIGTLYSGSVQLALGS